MAASTQPPSSRVIVAGGAGYIGSHMVAMLRAHGLTPVVVDNLSTGFANAVGDAVLERGDIGDRAFMDQVLQRHRPACVMHFAAFSQVAESVRQPDRYWHNNLVQTLNLLASMQAAGVRHFVFSSTAAVYGNPVRVPIAEDHPCAPINPYGHTKLAVEFALLDFAQSWGLRSVALRYFNAAGATPDASLGERHDPETHLLPLVLQVASGRRPFIARYGTQHATPDGSCIRDYVHVDDLCAAHLAALRQLEQREGARVYNLGNGSGHSVTEVIEAARRVTGHPIPVRDEPPRAGDPPVLVADASLARTELGWSPRFPGLDTLIAHAWAWEQRQAAHPPA